jgi:hypothetical protein
MFQSSSKRLRAWLSRVDDLLADHPAEAKRQEQSRHRDPQPHPHRHPLRWDRTRRPGSLPPRPAHCISPIRTVADDAGRERAAR